MKRNPEIDTIKASLREWYLNCTEQQLLEGINWYANASRRMAAIAESTGYTFTEVCCVTAILSPRKRWEKNITVTENVLKAHSEGGTYHVKGIFTANVVKAMNYLDGLTAELNGPKVTAFALNLSGSTDAVTIDSWMYRAAGMGDDWETPVRTRLISEAVTELAAEMRLHPCQLQACVWVSIRSNSKA